MRYKTDTEALILGALAEGPLHGYAIVKKVKESSGGVFKLSEGQLYPMLHRMQDKGWLSSEWVTEGGGPARKTYSLLEAGTAELETRKAEFAEFTQAVGGVMQLRSGLEGSGA